MSTSIVKPLVLALYDAGYLPTKGHATSVYVLARDTEDSVESVANAMDFWGFDGSVAFDMYDELEEL